MRIPVRQSRGFSLIEIVIVLFLTGLILYCVAGLTDRTFKTMKFLQEKSTTLESATLACQRLGQEMREMVAAPALGADSISFLKVIPSEALCVGNVVADDPLTWKRAYPTDQLATIKYSTADSKVTRQVNSEPAMEIAVDVNTFQVSQSFTAAGGVTSNRPGLYLIRLAIQEDRRVVTFETVVTCPGVPQP